MSIPEGFLQKLRSADERKEAHDPVRELLCDFLQLAIDDYIAATRSKEDTPGGGYTKTHQSESIPGWGT